MRLRFWRRKDELDGLELSKKPGHVSEGGPFVVASDVAASAVVSLAFARIVRTSAGEIDVHDGIYRAPDALLEGLHVEFISPSDAPR